MKLQMHPAVLFAASLLTTGLFGAGMSAQCETDALTGSESVLGWLYNHEYSSCLSLTQDALIVGAAYDRTYVFSRSGSVWTEDAILPTTTVSVARDGDTIVMGDSGESTFFGSAFVYVGSGSTWTLQQTLSSTAPELDRFFGDAVAISGDTLAVGQPGPGNPFVGDPYTPGDVHVFVRNAGVWSLQQVLTPSDQVPLVADSFGTSLAIQGDRIVVGADQYSPGQSVAPGAVYVYERSGTTWAETAKLTAVAPVIDDRFGHAVALDGATLAVAKPERPLLSLTAAAYVFVESGGTWSLQAELPVAGATSIALQGDLCLVGAERDIAGGSATFFARNGTSWAQTKKLYGSPGAGRFGNSVALEGLTAAVLAPAATPDQLFLVNLDASGCPGAAFEGAPLSGVEPLTVDFTDLSTGSVTDWSWSFGDGGTSDLRDPSHVYNVGTYNVSLLVEGPGGRERTAKEDYVDALLAASATIRNGSGVNGLYLTSLNQPVMGTQWDLEIDHSHHGAALSLLRGHAAPLAGSLTGFGELLINVGSMRLYSEGRLSPSSPDLYSLSVPVDIAFVGTQGYFQGAIFFGSAELTNAIDAVVGF